MNRRRIVISLAGAALAALALGSAQPETDAPVSPPPGPAPSTPRDFYNAGTRRLAAGKPKEAEAMLEHAVASQDDRLQPPALYNLGQARFALGIEELKKGPNAQPAKEQGTEAGDSAQEAIRSATASLAANQVDKMVQSYLQGRGARRELRSAMRVVKRALQVYGGALNKWQRASGDFKSAAELDPADPNARHNAEAVDRNIALLIDSIQELEKMAQALGQQKEELGQKMKELRGRIPEPDMPPGAAGDDEEEEEDKPNGPREGEMEGPSRDGQEERPVSEEQAGWILDGYKLDQGRRLPMGQGEPAEPRNRNRPTW